MSLGLAWIAAIASPTAPYIAFVFPFIVSGIGMGMFFAPIANLVLSAVRPEEEGKASGANNAIREVGGVFGVAVLASVFSANGSYVSPQSFVDGHGPGRLAGRRGRRCGRRGGAGHPALGRGRPARHRRCCGDRREARGQRSRLTQPSTAAGGAKARRPFSRLRGDAHDKSTADDR